MLNYCAHDSTPRRCNILTSVSPADRSMVSTVADGSRTHLTMSSIVSRNLFDNLFLLGSRTPVESTALLALIISDSE